MNTCKHCGAAAYAFAEPSDRQRGERLPLCARCYARHEGIQLDDENHASPDDHIADDTKYDDDDVDALMRTRRV